MYGAQNMHMYQTGQQYKESTDFVEWLLNERQAIIQLSNTRICDRDAGELINILIIFLWTKYEVSLIL